MLDGWFVGEMVVGWLGVTWLVVKVSGWWVIGRSVFKLNSWWMVGCWLVGW